MRSTFLLIRGPCSHPRTHGLRRCLQDAAPGVIPGLPTVASIPARPGRITPLQDLSLRLLVSQESGRIASSRPDGSHRPLVQARCFLLLLARLLGRDHQEQTIDPERRGDDEPEDLALEQPAPVRRTLSPEDMELRVASAVCQENPGYQSGGAAAHRPRSVAAAHRRLGPPDVIAAGAV